MAYAPVPLSCRKGVLCGLQSSGGDCSHYQPLCIKDRVVKAMKKMVISMDDAQRQFAFVKGNRPVKRQNRETEREIHESLWTANPYHGNRW